MNGYASVWMPKTGPLSIPISCLEIARLVAHKHGFTDIDVDKDDTGVKITAHICNGGTVTCKARTEDEAAEKLVERIMDR